jgi:O-acetyl-ADP-ribose deacetylase (regulator of RNase III)
MGAGLALEFKRCFPEIMSPYQAACRDGSLVPGKILPTKTRDARVRIVLNFPTKDHWRHPSNLTWIDQGLDRLLALAGELGITSVAVPALGCGYGGLHWADVLALMQRHLTDSEIEFHVYPPA